jgi:hypothetical protein
MLENLPRNVFLFCLAAIILALLAGCGAATGPAYWGLMTTQVGLAGAV